MRLSVTFYNCARPPEYLKHLELTFKEAVLNYCPSMEKLSYWQERRHPEYLQARQRGMAAIYPLLTHKERGNIISVVQLH